jgi:hypothetical protein
MRSPRSARSCARLATRCRRFRAVELLVALVIALCGLVIGYAFGLGGALSTLIFLAVLLTGAVFRAAQPLLQKLRP